MLILSFLCNDAQRLFTPNERESEREHYPWYLCCFFFDLFRFRFRFCLVWIGLRLELDFQVALTSSLNSMNNRECFESWSVWMKLVWMTYTNVINKCVLVVSVWGARLTTVFTTLKKVVCDLCVGHRYGWYCDHCWIIGQHAELT